MKVDLARGISEELMLADFPVNIGVRAGTRLYRGPIHALNEVCRGLATMYPHKRAAVWLKGASPFLRPVLPIFSREGISIQEVQASDLSLPAKIIEGLKKDTLVAVLAADDPATGQLFAIEELIAAFMEKKVHTVVLSHSAHLRKSARQDVHPYEIRLSCWTAVCTVASIGARAKTDDLIQGGLLWSELEKTEFQSQVQLGSIDEDQTKIEMFEGAAPAGARPLFAKGFARIFDRAVISWSDLDAGAIQDVMKATGSTGVESLSHSRWPSWGFDDYLIEQGVAANDVRGTLLVPLKDCTPETSAAIVQAAAEIRKLQG